MLIPYMSLISLASPTPRKKLMVWSNACTHLVSLLQNLKDILYVYCLWSGCGLMISVGVGILGLQKQ